MGLRPRQCHIAYFSIDQCERVVAVVGSGTMVGCEASGIAGQERVAP
jgi:hypothetical protein